MAFSDVIRGGDLKGDAAMFTDSVQHRTMAEPQPTTGIITRTVDHMRQFICGLHGHDSLLHFGEGRMSLQCTSCGYETPGWDISEEPQQQALRAKPRAVSMPLVRQRRAA